jgi:flagellar basal body-associated protein FliL
MNRAILIIAVLAGLGAAGWFWMQPAPSGRQASPPVSVQVVEQAAQVPDSVAAPVAAPTVAAPATLAAPATVAEAETPAPDAAVLQGPFEINLGTHGILLKTAEGAQKRMLDVEVVLVTSNVVTRKEIINRRKQLVRMLFFLGTRRAAASAEGDAGSALFRDHLVERYRNVIKTGAITALKFPTWKVRDWNPAPAE